MRVVPRPSNPNSGGTADTPLLFSRQTSPPETISSPPQPQVTYTEIQHQSQSAPPNGFKKIFNPTPENSVPSTPTVEDHPISLTNYRILSPENTLTPPQQQSPELPVKENHVPLPVGAAPTILRAVSPMSEESTTSISPENTVQKLGFKARLMKQPLPKLDTSTVNATIEEEKLENNMTPSVEAQEEEEEGAVGGVDPQLTQQQQQQQQRPLSPETSF